MDNYARFGVAFAKGEGMYLYDTKGDKYLDFNAGIAVTSLGHSHPHLLSCLQSQLNNLLHVSNLYEIPEQLRLATRLCEGSFADKVFFCNSGAEAVEAMLKLARRYYALREEADRQEIIAVRNAFHGRTFGALAASGNEAHLDGFGERLAGFRQVAFGNSNLLRAAVNDKTAAILIEPVQGEGGVQVADLSYLRELRQVADEFDLLLLLDEVQCGNGRTGKMWAHEWAGITPDIMATAKGLGGGFPIGALLATDDVAKAFTAGSHGSTFGGNPLAMAAGHAVLDVILADGFLHGICEKGKYMWDKADDLVQRFPAVFDGHSGSGLMQGLRLKDCVEAKVFVAKALEHKLLLVGAGNNVVRLLPPLIVEEGHIDLAFDIFMKISEAL